MAYGSEIRNARGEVTLGVTDRITRLIFSTVTGLDESDSVTLSAAAGKQAFWVCDGFNNGSVAGFPHKITRTGDTFAWEPRETNGGCISNILIFIYT